MENIFENQTFEKHNYTEKSLEKGEYENCIFIGCNLSFSDLSSIKFIDCTFQKCNLSMIKVRETSFQNIHFSDCKLHGIEWNQASNFLFEVDFENCLLDFSSFIGVKMKKTAFRACHIEEVDFSDADLSENIFEKCDFTKSIFRNTLLEKADFTTSFGYVIDPEQNKMKKSKFSLEGIPGLLTKYNIIIK